MQAQGQNRSATSLRNQIFDSNGPDMRVRGNAFQVHEKYQALAKDALTSGDRVLAENYLQHAEHYFRIIEAINEATAAEQRARQASWDSQPQPSMQQPVQYTDGAQPEQGGNPVQDLSQDGSAAQHQAQNQDGSYPQGQQQNGQYQNNNQRRREGGRDNNRDNNRDNYRDNREGRENNRDNNRENREQNYQPRQQRYENRNENRNNDTRGNYSDNQANGQGYGNSQGQGQGQGQAEYQPHNQTQQQGGQSQDPLYDGVDEDNGNPDTQAAMGGRR